MARKIIEMTVKVSVPSHMSASEARREVRTLISSQCNYAAEPDDVKALKVSALK